MTDTERKELELKIREEIENLKNKLEDLKDYTGPVAPDNAIGRISRMDAINNKSIFEASERNLRFRISQLEQALKMTGDDDFGLCIQCRQSIPMERLRLRPEIRLCAGCFKKPSSSYK